MKKIIFYHFFYQNILIYQTLFVNSHHQTKTKRADEQKCKSKIEWC